VNRALVDDIAAAVLYEGYLLYPYRASALKNQQRFNFGVVAPRRERQAEDGGWFIHTECLARAAGTCELDVRVRFLHLTYRTVESPNAHTARGWQEAIEREVAVRVRLEDLCASPVQQTFGWPAAREIEPRPEADGIEGTIVRSCESLLGIVDVQGQRLPEGLFKITVRISNITDPPHTDDSCRAAELERSLVSTHTILHLADGEFISLIDPPADVQAIASACRQLGAWPVLVGEEADRDAVLASPIILYDHPQIAKEGAGDFFDGTEIDEMLVLRILTMTDEEKREMREGDPRARRMLERTESLSEAHMMRLHGVLRELQPAHDEDTR
jgi:hydrogenase maturation protease